MKTILFTCEKNKFLLNGFAHQWRKYSNLSVEVSGLEKESKVPDTFFNLGTGNYDVNHWSDQVIDTLKMTKDELVLFVLDDYWLIRKIDISAMNRAIQVLRATNNTYAFDVSTNTMYGEHKYISSLGVYDLFVNDNKYAYSYQAYIWKREKLLSCLIRNETPWESELRGFSRMGGNPNVIMSFQQYPLWYANVRYKGDWDFKGNNVHPKRTLSQDDWKELKNLGYIR